MNVSELNNTLEQYCHETGIDLIVAKVDFSTLDTTLFCLGTSFLEINRNNDIRIIDDLLSGIDISFFDMLKPYLNTKPNLRVVGDDFLEHVKIDGNKINYNDTDFLELMVKMIDAKIQDNNSWERKK